MDTDVDALATELYVTIDDVLARNPGSMSPTPTWRIPALDQRC